VHRYAVVGTPFHSRARLHDRHVVAARDIEAVAIGVAAVRLPAVGDLVDANLP
jgi:hypothetical protein